MPSAIVLVIDGLSAGHLGPYGNTWIETPGFNSLASESLTLENSWSSQPRLDVAYECLWRGADAWQRPCASFATSDLLQHCAASGVVARLLTDDSRLIAHRLAASFAEHIEIDSASEAQLAVRWDQTQLARFFAESLRAIEADADDSLTWLHARGLGELWDAPRSYRQRFVDEDDPDAYNVAAVPHFTLESDYDPDALHAVRCACAGQVVLLDRCLSVLLSGVREAARRRELLLVVTSTRGFPLGEHLHVGWPLLPLYRELLHVPLFVRFPDGRRRMQRHAGLGEPRDLTRILRDWFADPLLTDAVSPAREFSISRGDGAILLRTPAWHVHFPAHTDNREADLAAAQLFVSPDDFSEVNDVSDRCRGVVESAWDWLTSCGNGTDACDAWELPAVLRERVE